MANVLDTPYKLQRTIFKQMKRKKNEEKAKGNPMERKN